MPSAVEISDRPQLAEHSHGRPKRQFRGDIQALRAIAVALVVVYHLRPDRMTGGYIGVDVFFVISGFLITGHLIRDASRTGRVKLGAFWAARARRILPASLLTIAVTTLLTIWLVPVTLFENLQKQALASIFYVQNWVLAADAVDYSAAENDATAFQHFWSLSVEEQFYLFWPLLVFVGLWVVTRKTASSGQVQDEPRLRRVLVALFGVVVLASLAYSVFTVANGQSDAYFVTTTRIWELGAGGLLATVSVRRLTRAWRYALGYLGLAAIAVSAFALTNDSPFPGLAALPVILGTCAVILAGTPGRDEGDVSLARFDPWTFGSSLRIVQWLGDRSYSLYLWHFPVIVLWPIAIGRKVGYLDLAIMLALSLILADLSYRFVEQPVRRSSFFKNSTPRSLIAGLLAMLLAAGLTVSYWALGTRTTDSWEALAEEAASLPQLGAETVADGQISAFTTGKAMMTPSPVDAEQDISALEREDECIGGMTDAATPTCTAGDPDGKVSIALVGDSHARMYFEAMGEVAENNGWLLRTYLHNSCPLNPVPSEREARGTVTCTKPNVKVMQELLADPPDVVVTTWYSMSKFVDDGSPGAPGAAGFAQYWNQLEDAGIRVLVLRDVPIPRKDIPSCIAANYDHPDACSFGQPKAMRGAAQLREAAEMAPRATVADFTDLFCADERCMSVIGNVIVYRDKHHITDTYARTMVPRLTEAVKAVVPGSGE